MFVLFSSLPEDPVVIQALDLVAGLVQADPGIDVTVPARRVGWQQEYERNRNHVRLGHHHRVLWKQQRPGRAGLGRVQHRVEPAPVGVQEFCGVLDSLNLRIRQDRFNTIDQEWLVDHGELQPLTLPDRFPAVEFAAPVIAHHQRYRGIHVWLGQDQIQRPVGGCEQAADDDINPAGMQRFDDFVTRQADEIDTDTQVVGQHVHNVDVDTHQFISAAQIGKRQRLLQIANTQAATFFYRLESRVPLLNGQGRNLVEGVPKTLTITDSEVREALAEPISAIVEAVRQALERTPPELSADIMDKGIVLSGGGALIRNLDQRLRVETGLPVVQADDPLCSVVLGTGRMLEDMDLLRKVSLR